MKPVWTAGNANVESISAGVALVKAASVTLLQCKLVGLHCEQCHVDKGHWATFNHHKHKCSNCTKMFCSEKACVGVELASDSSVADNVY